MSLLHLDLLGELERMTPAERYTEIRDYIGEWVDLAHDALDQDDKLALARDLVAHATALREGLPYYGPPEV